MFGSEVEVGCCGLIILAIIAWALWQILIVLQSLPPGALS